jgi:hypothetical protein
LYLSSPGFRVSTFVAVSPFQQVVNLHSLISINIAGFLRLQNALITSLQHGFGRRVGLLLLLLLLLLFLL